MFIHSLVSPNISLHPPSLSKSFLYPQFYNCSESAFGSAAFTIFTSTSFLLLLPLSILVFSVGIRRWRKQRHTSTVKPVSHSDFLTYNIIAVEQIGLLGSVYYCSGIYMDEQRMMRAGIYVVFIVYLGRLLFQCLTCVEQYVAVIHPTIYLSLKTGRGIRVRNASIGCIWLVCLVMLFVLAFFSPYLTTLPFFIFFAIGLFIISFCSFSVLCALVRPGPGEVSVDRKRVSEAKKRAFYTIATIKGVTFLKYVGLMVCMAVQASSLLDYHDGCAVLMSSFWFCLPSSLSVPLLFLSRAGKLPCFSHKDGSE